MLLVVGYGGLVLLAIAASLIERVWRRRIEKTRHKADYPMVDRYPPPQASPMQSWPW
jgi:hypothetical protein